MSSIASLGSYLESKHLHVRTTKTLPKRGGMEKIIRKTEKQLQRCLESFQKYSKMIQKGIYCLANFQQIPAIVAKLFSSDIFHIVLIYILGNDTFHSVWESKLGSVRVLDVLRCCIKNLVFIIDIKVNRSDGTICNN